MRRCGILFHTPHLSNPVDLTSSPAGGEEILTIKVLEYKSTYVCVPVTVAVDMKREGPPLLSFTL